MLGRVSIAFAVAALLVAPAFAEAADLGPYRPPAPPMAPAPPPPPPVYEDEGPSRLWSGGYWGISAGYGYGETTLTFDRATRGAATAEPEGLLGALTLGYNVEMPGGLVVGIEGDLGLADLSADEVEADGRVLKSSLGPLWGTMRGRLGVAFGRTLLYGTAGAAFMDVDDIAIGGAAGDTAVNESFRSGFVAGAGLERMFGPNITAKIEYLHMDFGSFDGVSDTSERFSFDNKVDLVRAGLNYKF